MGPLRTAINWKRHSHQTTFMQTNKKRFCGLRTHLLFLLPGLARTGLLVLVASAVTTIAYTRIKLFRVSAADWAEVGILYPSILQICRIKSLHRSPAEI